MFGKKKRENDNISISFSCVKDCPRDERCPKWAKMTTNHFNTKTRKVEPKIVGRCSDAWLPFLIAELRISVDELTKIIKLIGKIKK